MGHALVIFRPDARDARQDFHIKLVVAQDLYDRGLIAQDATNGGYCPAPGSRYNVAQHKIQGKRR